jgi:hypothetical protein
MLNLRQINVDSERSHSDGGDTARRSTIRFNATIMVGNMGESLQFGVQSYDNGWEGAEGEDVAIPLSDLEMSSEARSVHQIYAHKEVSVLFHMVCRTIC